MRALPAGARRWFWLVPVVAGTLLVSWLLIFAAWLVLPSARTIEIDIPLGTASRIARGEDVQVISDELRLRRGDTLLIANHDVVAHRVGPARAEAGRSTRTKVNGAFFGSAALVCTVHPGGSIGVAPQARPGLEATALPTTLLFVPLVVATGLALGVARRLDLGSDLPPQSGRPAESEQRPAS